MKDKRNTLVFILVVLGVLLLDQVSKAMVVATLEPGESVTLIPGLLDVTHVRNTGAAFGLFAGNNQFVFFGALIIVVVLLGWFVYTRERKGVFSFVALGLMVGGALGNLADRIFRGKVVDFLDLRWWPVFNVADIAIVAGVLMLFGSILYDLYRQKPGASKAAEVDR